MAGLWPKDLLKDFQILRRIGSGSYSTVWEALHIPSQVKVAIKREDHLFDDLTDCKRVLREIRLLHHLRHPNVVRLIDMRADPCMKPPTVYLILELAETDLKAVIRNPSMSLSIHEVMFVMYSIFKGLKYIHSAQVLHRDIKPGNILINSNYRIMVCDFGLARSIAKDKGPAEFRKSKSKAFDRYKEDLKSSILLELSPILAIIRK